MSTNMLMATLLLSALVSTIVTGQNPLSTSTIWINELHYDNDGTDSGEFIEIAGVAGITLDYGIYLYNGADNGQVYAARSFVVVLVDQQNGYGTHTITNGIQNGPGDGIALVYTGGGGTDVVQFISYEGTLTATNGPAMGMTSIDIGVSENGNTESGTSLSLRGNGTAYEDFTWDTAITATPGTINNGQIMTTNCPTDCQIGIETAQNSADAAQGAADMAGALAYVAQQTADAAQDSADTAQDSADAAQQTADEISIEMDKLRQQFEILKRYIYSDDSNDDSNDDQ